MERLERDEISSEITINVKLDFKEKINSYLKELDCKIDLCIGTCNLTPQNINVSELKTCIEHALVNQHLIIEKEFKIDIENHIKMMFDNCVSQLVESVIRKQIQAQIEEKLRSYSRLLTKVTYPKE